MGQLENQPTNPVASNVETAETVLRSVTEELQNLQQNLLGSLREDVEQLKAEKSRLLDEIKQLQAQQQTAQQQLGTHQLAQVLATHLQEQLQQQLAISANLPQRVESSSTDATSVNGHNRENAYQVLASLDTTVSTTLRTLQQDLSSYQSGLSQQLSRMYSLEQQGEAILEALVNRLRTQLEQEVLIASSQQSTPSVAEPRPLEVDKSAQITQTELQPVSPPPLPTVPVPAPTATTLQPQTRSKGFSSVQTGLLLILLSAVALSLYNVAIRIIVRRREIFGLIELGGLIAPNLGNSLLILLLRMLVVVPMMGLLAPILYPQVWHDLKQLVTSRVKPGGVPFNQRVLPLAIVSGCFLFLSQVLIYIALGQIRTGIAITLFFVYPIITVLLSWLLFRDRPTLLRVGVIGLICWGDFLVLGGLPAGASANSLGSATAVGSGVAFAFYVILTQICAASLHPVPFSIVNFITILLLSFLSLMVPLPVELSAQVNLANWPSLIVGGLILGVLTLVGYLFNNFGIRQIGAARASIIGASGPALTAILAYFIIQEELIVPQVWGMLLVTAGVAALSLERMRKQVKAAKGAK